MRLQKSLHKRIHYRDLVEDARKALQYLLVQIGSPRCINRREAISQQRCLTATKKNCRVEMLSVGDRLSALAKRTIKLYDKPELSRGLSRVQSGDSTNHVSQCLWKR